MSNGSANRTTASLALTNDPDAYRDMESSLLEAVEQAGYPEAAVFAVRIALEEAVVNGFKHGCKGRADAIVKVDWAVDPKRIEITIQDEGTGFEPGDVPDPRLPEFLERPSGRGLLLMRSYMTDVQYNDAGNAVTMVYEKSAD
jgi:serine/threonine-protein kinase RsbW